MKNFIFYQFFLSVLILISCDNKSTYQEYENINISKESSLDTVSFKYFIDLCAQEKSLPEYLWLKFFPDSLKKEFLKAKKIVGDLVLNNTKYYNSNENHVITFESEDGSPCQNTYILIYSKNNKPTYSNNVRFCDCNEPYCKGETLELNNDSIIKITTSIWGGYDEDEINPTKDTIIYRYLVISKQGKVKRLEPTLKIPKGFKLFNQLVGDLNNDNVADTVLIIKKVDTSNIIYDEYRGNLDRNRRGIIIKLSTFSKRFTTFENQNCFSSENEDGGVYFAPDLSFELKNNILKIKYDHGRYGNWQYLFRYQNSVFELIGFDSYANIGPIIKQITSVNFSTKKIIIKENTTPENIKNPIFIEKKGTFEWNKRISLFDIEDFDEFNLMDKLNVVFK